MTAFLALLGAIPRWAWEALGAVAILAAIWLSGASHERVKIERQVVKQEVQVEKRVIETDHSHDQELADLRAYRASHPVGPVRLCVPDGVPKDTAQGQPSPTPGAIQQVPEGDHPVRTIQHPDISGLLDLLAVRADAVSATLRRRQELEP